MFHMLSCFNLRPGTELGALREALVKYTAHMQGLDLVVSNSPVGERQSDTSMDTDSERQHRYFTTTIFRDRAQVDAAYDYIKAHTEPGYAIHQAVYSKVQDPIFICWQDT
jgi:hypothetical protein